MDWTPPTAPEPPPLEPASVAPGPVPESEPRSRLRRRVLVGSLTFVLVAGLAAGGISAFRFLHGAGDRLVSLAPDDSLAFLTVYLDPPGSQKLAVNDLRNKFPNVATSGQLDATVDKLLDQGLASSGLSHSDIRPWLGGQIAEAVSSTAPHGSSQQPDAALLIASTDNGKARAALKKFESSPDGRKHSWTTQDHDGVSLDVGQRKTNGELMVWCLVNDTLVLSNSTSYANEIIDTAHGSHPALASTGDYSKALSRLPADKLGFIYVDVPRFSTFTSGGASGAHSAFGDLSPGLAHLDAYQGAGLALTAQSDGVAIDGVVDYDASKMTPAQRAATQVAPDTNKALAFVPEHAYGVYALTGLPQTIRWVLDALNSAGSGGAGLGDVARLFIGHLTGDAALEVDQLPGQNLPAAALIVAADSDASAQQLLSNVVRGACSFGAGCDPASTLTETYRGTTISTLQEPPSLSSFGVAPSWAVKDSMAILATSPGELKAVLDARAGSNVLSSQRFAGALHHADATNNSLMYLDVSSIEAAVRSALPAGERGRFDSEVAPYLDHFKALVTTSTNGSDHSTARSFVQVQ